MSPGSLTTIAVDSAMNRKRMKRANERADRWAATDPKMRELRERIDFHRARLAAQERAQARRRASS